MDIMPPTFALHSLADQAAHGVDDTGAGCTVHTATQGQEKSSLEGAKYCVNQVQIGCAQLSPQPSTTL